MSIEKKIKKTRPLKKKSLASKKTVKKALGWDELGLSQELLLLVQKQGFKTPTPIQQRTIPASMKGRDLLASARTGSGKTAAFSFPLIEKIKGRKGTYGLVLCPTREIALQTLETLKMFGDPMGLNSIALIGGVPLNEDMKNIRSGPNIIVGTPGRICDHIERGNLWLEYVEYLVFDEADRMLDMGFAKEIDRILVECPHRKQSLLFSATISKTIEKLSERVLNKPARIAIGSSHAVASSVEHEIFWVPEEDKKHELLKVLRNEKGRIIVFTRTKEDCVRLYRSVHAASFHDATYLSSDRRQVDRESALEGLKTGEFRILFATDVAARGIHVEDVAYVINYDLPMNPEDYIHRIGRTGRKDASGVATSFVTKRDLRRVEEIEQLLGKKLKERVGRNFDTQWLSQVEVPHLAAPAKSAPRKGNSSRTSKSTSQPRSRSSAPARSSSRSGGSSARGRDSESRSSRPGSRSESASPRGRDSESRSSRSGSRSGSASPRGRDLESRSSRSGSRSGSASPRGRDSESRSSRSGSRSGSASPRGRDSESRSSRSGSRTRDSSRTPRTRTTKK